MMSFVKGFFGFLIALIMGVIMNAHAQSFGGADKQTDLQLKDQKSIDSCHNAQEKRVQQNQQTNQSSQAQNNSSRRSKNKDGGRRNRSPASIPFPGGR